MRADRVIDVPVAGTRCTTKWMMTSRAASNVEGHQLINVVEVAVAKREAEHLIDADRVAAEVERSVLHWAPRTELNLPKRWR